jgi:ABC-type transporter Mla subunit MlaD
MAWLHQFFKRNTCQEQPTSASSEAATAAPPKTPGSSTVMQLVAEETIMAVAQWLVNLVNYHIQAKPEVPVDSVPAPEGSSATMTEELLSKFGKLIEQLYEREERLLPLENRLRQVEAVLTQKAKLEPQLQESMQLLDRLQQRLVRVEDLAGRVNIHEIDILVETTEQLTQRVDQSSSTIAHLDTRMIQLEAGLKQNDSLAEKINQMQQSMAVLEHRMGHVEKLLARFSIVPKLVEENRHGIVSLKHQIALNQTSLDSGKPSQNGSKLPAS